jgi:hypothetical protein
MSQTNGRIPPFNFNVQQYMFDSGAPRPNNNGPQQWLLAGQRSRPRSVQHNLPSPSTSVRSTVTAPARSYDRSSFVQPNLASVNERIDPNLLGLEYSLPSPGQAARNNYNPIDRNYHEGPWDPYHLRNSDDESSVNQPSTNFKNYRHGPGSIGSAAPISDSGFWTQSVVSHEPGRLEQSYMSSSLSQQVDKLKVRSLTSEAPRMTRVPSDQRSQLSLVSSRSGYRDKPLKCQICGDESKCKSDYKYVVCYSMAQCYADALR